VACCVEFYVRFFLGFTSTSASTERIIFRRGKFVNNCVQTTFWGRNESLVVEHLSEFGGKKNGVLF
jgi:hypothetical protein